MRATISRCSPPAAPWTTAATLDTSDGDNQLMMAPSLSRPASLNMPSRNAATRILGFCSGRTPNLNPFTSKVSYFLTTFSPDNASFRKRTTSRTFL